MTTLATNLGPYTRSFGVSAPTGTAGDLGDIITIDSEDMVIVGGAGTTVLTVDRGANGTWPSSHLAGATVSAGTNAEAVVTGSATFTGDVSTSKTITSATHSVERLVRSEITITPASSFAMSPASDSLAAVRGGITLSSGKSITAGFLYGAQGKVTVDGATIAVGSGHIAGVYAQMSGNGATVTNGHVAIVIASGQNLPNSAYVDAIYVESGAGPINSCIKTVLNANFAFDLSEQNVTNTMCKATGTVNGSQTGWIKVKVQGTTGYLPVYPGVV